MRLSCLTGYNINFIILDSSCTVTYNPVRSTAAAISWVVKIAYKAILLRANHANIVTAKADDQYSQY